MFRFLRFLALAAILPLPLVAADAPQASGKFESSKTKFDVGGAYAFWSRSADDEPLIKVAVSNSGFNVKAFDAFYDPEPVINTMFVDDETAVVYFEFQPNGKYHGLSYYLGPGDGCGFCSDPSVKSSVRIADQHAKGHLAYKGSDRQFDIDIDVPVAPKEWGQALAADGGEPGKAYRAYNAAMDKGDRKAIFAVLDESNRTTWTKAEGKDDLAGYLDYRAEKIHWRLKDARVVSGFVRGDNAVLLVKGSSPVIDHIHGQVTMTRENGAWKISDEVYQTGE